MTGGRPHHPVDADRVFVDELLTEAQALLGDPRIRVVHVRHTGPPASDARPSSESDATSLAQRAAWMQTVELATTLRDLWEHAWLPAPPEVVSVRYVEDSTGLRVEVTGQAQTANAVDVNSAADRLLVRGFLPDEQSPPGRIRAHRGGAELVVDASAERFTMMLSEGLDVPAHTRPNTLSALPQQVSTISDGR